MIKAKLKIWIALFAVYIFIQSFGGNITAFVAGLFIEPVEYKISIESDGNKTSINNKKIKTSNEEVVLSYSNQNPDIIITKNDDPKEGYEKMEDFLYTPFVLLTKDGWENDDSSIKNLTENGIHKYTKDIRYILEAIEQNKTWEEIGMTNEDVLGKTDSPVTLKIPNKHTEDYQEIKSYIMMVLNDYNPYDNKIELEKRADLILSKCIEVESVTSLVNSLYGNTKKVDFGMVLCKESVIADCSYNDFDIAVINIIHPVKVSYNLYVKKDIDGKIDIVKQIVQAKKFYSSTGLRNIESNKGIKYSDLDEVLQVLDCIELIHF